MQSGFNKTGLPFLETKRISTSVLFSRSQFSYKGVNGRKKNLSQLCSPEYLEKALAFTFFQNCRESKDVENIAPQKTITVGFLVADHRGVVNVVEIQNEFTEISSLSIQQMHWQVLGQVV